MNCDPVPSLDVCFGELLCEEQRLSTQFSMIHDNATSKVVNITYATQSQGKDKFQCFSCKEFGPMARNCPKKLCRYCKKGHIIKELLVWPQNRPSHAFQAVVQSSSLVALSPVNADSSMLTPARVQQMQQMIISAFFALGLQGKGTQLPSFLFIDSSASNHMTGSLMGLHDIRKYEGDQHIQIVDGSTLPITAIGTLGSSFHDVCLSWLIYNFSFCWPIGRL